ncbi:hypothetical protein AB0C61_36370 [Streptomyces sp. NPDC048680]|uniref:hypothetical protein n=1 Tax=Streptomyces sp. NPDC048680 TaxID=3155492 RepID=UPI0034414CC4
MGRGARAETADRLLGIFAAARAGEFSAVDPTLAALIGREPLSMSSVLHEQLSSDNSGRQGRRP